MILHHLLFSAETTANITFQHDSARGHGKWDILREHPHQRGRSVSDLGAEDSTRNLRFKQKTLRRDIPSISPQRSLTDRWANGSTFSDRSKAHKMAARDTTPISPRLHHRNMNVPASRKGTDDEADGISLVLSHMIFVNRAAQEKRGLKVWHLQRTEDPLQYRFHESCDEASCVESS